MRIRAFVATALLLALSGPGWAGSQGNPPDTPVTVGDVSAQVTLTATAQTIHFVNDGANPAIVRVFVTCETVAAITAADVKARSIKPDEEWALDFQARERLTTCTPTSTGYGYIGFAHIDSGAGLTTTIRWFSK